MMVRKGRGGRTSPPPRFLPPRVIPPSPLPPPPLDNDDDDDDAPSSPFSSATRRPIPPFLLLFWMTTTIRRVGGGRRWGDAPLTSARSDMRVGRLPSPRSRPLRIVPVLTPSEVDERPLLPVFVASCRPIPISLLPLSMTSLIHAIPLVDSTTPLLTARIKNFPHQRVLTIIFHGLIALLFLW